MRPFADKESRLLCRSSTLLVKELVSSARSLKLTRRELVLRIGSLEKLQGGFLGLTDFVGHAAAEIEDDTNGYGDVFGREILDLLLDVVFEDTEVIGLKACNQAVIRIGDGNVDKRQFHVDMDGLTLLNDPARCVMLSRRRGRRIGQQRARAKLQMTMPKSRRKMNGTEKTRGATNPLFTMISIVPGVIKLNLNHYRRFRDRSAPDFDTACTPQILQTSHRHR